MAVQGALLAISVVVAHLEIETSAVELTLEVVRERPSLLDPSGVGGVDAVTVVPSPQPLRPPR